MKKNNADHIGASGIILSARGYTINANPGPEIYSIVVFPIFYLESVIPDHFLVGRGVFKS